MQLSFQQINGIVQTYAPMLAIAGLGLVAVIFFRNKLQNRKEKFKELKIAKPCDAHGIIFGKLKWRNRVVYSPFEKEGSIGVFSASGTGKTSAIGIETLRSLCSNEKSCSNGNATSFVIDISGDICKNCPDMPNKLIYEPENPNTTAYNIFGSIDDLSEPDDQNEALEQLAFLLMPDNATNDNAKFFQDNGRKILTASLIAFYRAGMDFIEICVKIVGSSWQDLFRAIDETENETAIMYINGFAGTSQQNTAGCKQACDDALKVFSTNAKIKKSIHRPIENEITIQPKQIEEHNIFFIVDDPKLDLYSPLLNIVTSQLMQYISNRQVTEQSKSILLFLDEYASLKIDAMTILEAVRKYRKRKCRILLMSQNLADLEILYSKETTRAILSNLRFKVLLGGLGEVDSQKYFAELIGYKKTTKHSRSSNGKQTTHTESEAKEYIIDPAELDRQGKDTVILIHPESKGYMLLEKNYYFKYPKGYKKRA